MNRFGDHVLILCFLGTLSPVLWAQSTPLNKTYDIELFPAIGGPIPAWADKTRIWSPIWWSSSDGSPTPYGTFLGLEVLTTGKTDDAGVRAVIIRDDRFRTPEGFDMCTRIEDLIAAEDSLVAITNVWNMLYFHLESGWTVYFEPTPTTGYNIAFFYNGQNPVTIRP